jgi:mono/diheme cytochrome c family protein
VKLGRDRARKVTVERRGAEISMRPTHSRWLQTGASVLLLAVGAPAMLGCESHEEYRLRVAREVFDRKCARCHGSSKGEGPHYVEDFGADAPDLRQLWRSYGSPLSREALAEYIDGRRDVAAHGPRAMPVWGEKLYDKAPDGATVEQMRAGTIEMLLDYLETIQVREPG